MLKNILNLEGAQELTKNAQKSINGGKKMAGCDSVFANECAQRGGICEDGICNIAGDLI